MSTVVRATARHTAPAAPRADLRAALLDVLGDPALAWVRHRVLARLEDDGGGELSGVLQLLTATPAQRTAAAGLLGPGVVRGTRVAVRVEDLEQLLVEVVAWDRGLAAAVLLLEGPAPDEVPVALPETRGVPLEAPAPAAPAPAAATAPAAARAPVPAPARRAAVRELDLAAADAAGLALVDVVLALGLPVDHPDAPAPGSPGEGRPAVITLHGLRSTSPTWRPAPPGGTVWVCATPSVVAAVAVGAVQGLGVAPVVCLDALATSTASDPAWPGEAVVLVLDGLRAAGWQLRLNGGAGPEGAVLTELLASELDAMPWRTPDADAALAASDPLGAAAPGRPLLEQLVADVRRAV